tara:strand:- start:163 stop:1002 length:840 start_codon:yes stop_codon:yes gene_type:complete
VATLDEIRLERLLRPLEGPSGIVSLNPLAFQYQDQFYPNQMQYQYPPRTDISPTQDFYQLNSISPTQDFYQPRADISPTQDFYQPREFVNAPQNFYPPDLTTLRGLDMNRFQGVSDMSVIDETTNDEQDQEYIDQVEKSNNPLKSIMDFIGQFSPMQMIGKGIGAFFNPKGSDRYRPATAGIYGYSPRQLNQMNALGGYYSEPARAQRRLENRLANLIERRDSGKSYSQKNLDSITQSLSGAASQAQFATKKAASKSPSVGVSGYTARDSVRESRRGKV